MLARGAGVTLPRASVRWLVVGVDEPLLQHGPFEIPIDLGHEAEPRGLFADSCRRLRPEEWRAPSPGAREDIRQHQHRHVTPHAVALPGDPEEFATHRGLRRRTAVI